MERINYGDLKPKTFEEHIDFNYIVPHTTRIKYFGTDDIVPLHYSEDTLEILLCMDLVGEVTIEKNRFTAGGKQVFVIPPHTIHSTSISRCSGTMHVLKFSFPTLSRYLNVVEILAYNSCNLNQLPYSCPVYDELLSIVTVMIKEDDNIFSRMRSILSIFELLEAYKIDRIDVDYYGKKNENKELKHLITWTTENFSRKITLDEAADEVHYSKYHFCRWFKSLTNITYITFLNRLRVVEACKLLRQGKSISETCFECGFDDLPYFLQLFKKIQGCTPGKYIKHLQEDRDITI